MLRRQDQGSRTGGALNLAQKVGPPDARRPTDMAVDAVGSAVVGELASACRLRDGVEAVAGAVGVIKAALV